MIDFKIRSVFRESQFFLAICGGLLALETYCAAGLLVEFHAPLTVAFATLFVYNLSRCNVSFMPNPVGNDLILSLHGNRLNLFLAGISIPWLLLLVTGLNWHQGIILLFTGILSLAYMMPFSWNGKPLKGFRNMLVFKNILLSIIWSLATVIIPIASETSGVVGATSIFFLFARQFFFIYALTVVYDIRDIRSDTRSGLQTLATRLGENGVKGLALFSLLFFFLLSLAEPETGPTSYHALKLALSVSALCSALIVLNTHKGSKPGYFAFAVDGAMMLRPLLVIAFTCC